MHNANSQKHFSYVYCCHNNYVVTIVPKVSYTVHALIRVQSYSSTFFMSHRFREARVHLAGDEGEDIHRDHNMGHNYKDEEVQKDGIMRI